MDPTLRQILGELMLAWQEIAQLRERLAWLTKERDELNVRARSASQPVSGEDR